MSDDLIARLDALIADKTPRTRTWRLLIEARDRLIAAEAALKVANSELVEYGKLITAAEAERDALREKVERGDDRWRTEYPGASVDR